MLRRRNNINVRLIHNLRKRLWSAVKDDHNNSITELLGCSVIELKRHLEKQFKSLMTFNNYGKWHIDHKKPCALFDLSKLEERKKCFHYTNLQPLWAKDNLRKGIKYPVNFM